VATHATGSTCQAHSPGTSPHTDIVAAAFDAVSTGAMVPAGRWQGSSAARTLIQSHCDAGLCHCPPDWCGDDVQSEAVHVRAVAGDADICVVARARNRAR
jgi:hypothetical protein